MLQKNDLTLGEWIGEQIKDDSEPEMMCAYVVRLLVNVSTVNTLE